jgi:hypothetical protein
MQTEDKVSLGFLAVCALGALIILLTMVDWVEFLF